MKTNFIGSRVVPCGQTDGQADVNACKRDVSSVNIRSDTYSAAGKSDLRLIIASNHYNCQ